MKIEDLDRALKTIDGEEMWWDEKRERKSTLRRLICDALLFTPPEQKKLDEKNAAERYALSMFVHTANGSMEVKSEEVALIKKCLHERFPIWVAGQAREMVEPEAKEDAKEE